MKSVFIRELEHYSKSKIMEILGDNENIFNQLQEYAVIDNENDLYHFKYVGVIIIENCVINCYPKYISNKDNISSDFKQVLNVIKKYKKLHDDFSYENEELEDISFNLLSLMLFFIEDYYQNGIYTNIQNILEINGNGEINWDRTINDNFALIKENKPYYTELQTKYKIDDLYDYFRLLHEYIITDCSKRLEKSNLLEYFDLMNVELSDKTLDDFGDVDYILTRIEKELNIEFNTHKQKLLKSMHAYLSNKNSFTNENFLTLYGTSSYHVIWEEMCSQVFSNKLDKQLKDIINTKSNLRLIDIIEKPNWISNYDFSIRAKDTYIPDLITFFKGKFIIFDAKYYNIKFKRDQLAGQPGIESISKQYFYELAYKTFIDYVGFKGVKNAFLFPTYDNKIDNKGYVELKMLSRLGLENIQVIMLPASEINQLYLDNKKMDISRLNL